MQKSTLVKLYTQNTHTRPVPWTLAGLSQGEWIDTVLKPLLAAFSGCNASLEAPYRGQKTRSPATASDVWEYIGKIRLEMGIHTRPGGRRYDSYDSRDRPSHDVPLFWLGLPVDGATALITLAPRARRWGDYFDPEQLSQYLHEENAVRYLHSQHDLLALLAGIGEGLNGDLLAIQKKNRVRSLQTSAIKAQVQQIANTEGFAFKVETSSRFIIILIRLESGNQLRISIPFTQFESALPELHDAVTRLLSLNRRRISFRTEQCRHYGHDAGWNEPQPTADPTITGV